MEQVAGSEALTGIDIVRGITFSGSAAWSISHPM